MSGSRWGATRPRARTEDRWIDPMPPHGMAERLYAGIKARFGYWPADFLHVVKVAYRNRIPDRFTELARRLELERPWERELEELALGGMTITIERADGSRSSTYYPKGEEP